MPDIHFRSYHPGDELKIVDLFSQSGPHLRTTGFWNWINSKNPFGKSVVQIAEAGDKIIGHYAVMPVELRSNGDRVLAGFAIQAIIHEAFRNLNTLMRITEKVWEGCARKGIRFVYGFPNDNIWPVNLALMGWNHLCDFKSWELPMPQKHARFLQPSKNIKVYRLSAFNDKFNVLWEQSPIKSAGQWTMARNAHFLNWRFFGNPIQHYIVYAADLRGKPAGYIVLKLYTKGNTSYGHIVDILTTKQQARLLTKALLEEAFQFFRWSGVNTISCWMTPSNFYGKALSDLGFRPKGFNTHFGYKPIKGKVPDPMLKLDHWYMTMAASDAF